MVYDQLKKIAQEYIDDVNKVCNMMYQAYNLNTREELLNLRRIQGQGEFFINGKNTYCFHGRGCRFSNDGLKIDWDFGYGDIWCGLEPWKLAHYIRDNKNDSEWSDGNKIRKVFDELVANGKMKEKFGLYYFI